MATFYIDPRKTTNGSGVSLEDPYNQWPANMSAGNTYLQLADTICYQSNVRPASSGTASSRIVLGTCDENGVQILDGSRRATIQGITDSVNTIDLGTGGSRSYIDIISLKVIGSLVNSGAIQLRGGTEATVKNNKVLYCEVIAPSKSGIDMVGDGFVIKYNIIHDCFFDGIFCTAKNYEIAYNYIYNVDLANTIGDGLDIDLATDCGVSSVHHNIIKIDSKGQKQAAIIRADAGSMRCYDNIFIGGPGNSVYLDTPNMLFYRNYITNPNGEVGIGIGSSGVKIYGNIIEDTQIALSISESSITGIEIYNNTIVNSFRRTVSIASSVLNTSITFKNNIVLNSGTNDLLGSGRTILYPATTTWVSDYNCFFGPLASFSIAGVLYNSFSAYATATGQEVNSITQAPLLINKYPTSTSPLINAGTNLSINVLDFNGNIFKQTIGAYEFVPERPEATVRGVR